MQASTNGGAMSSNRETARRGAIYRTRRKSDEQLRLESRRAEMYAAEGHAGSIPRGNQDAEGGPLGQRRAEYERVLGH
jgi:hypothetical protein